MTRSLTFAIPKGRILDEALPLLARAGIEPEAEFHDKKSRALRFATNRPDISIIRVRAFDVATFVAHGAAQIGIVGSDVVEEFDYSELYAPGDLDIGHCRLSVAEPAGQVGGPLPSHLRIASKYPNLTRKHFEGLGIQAEVVKLNGAMELARAEGKLDWLNTDFALGSPYNIWMGVLGAGVFVLFTHGIDQLVAQRVLACRSVADGRKALLFCAAVILPMMLLFLMVGVLLWAHYQQTPIPLEIPENSLGKKQTDYVFPIFMLAEAPVGVKGLLLVGIFAAAMSSVSSALSALSSVTVMDLGLAKEGSSDEDKLKTGRGWTLFWGVVLVGVAFASREVKSVMDAAFSLVGLASGGLLGGVLLALTLKHGRGGPVMIGMGVSLMSMIGIKYGLKEAIHWPWYTAIGCGITLLVTMLANTFYEARENNQT